MLRSALLGLSLAALLIGCGGGSGTSNVPSPQPGPGGGPVSSPVVISVGAGEAGGVDIAVVSPAPSPVPNAEVLGTAAAGSEGGTAFSTGATIARGSTRKVLIFGRGLSGSMQVTVSGPQDFSISNVVGITAQDNTPGVAFNLSMSPAAALGARTVFLQSSNSNITAFTGGLEVVP